MTCLFRLFAFIIHPEETIYVLQTNKFFLATESHKRKSLASNLSILQLEPGVHIFEFFR